MKVWILIGLNFSHYEEFSNDPGVILGVFASKELAEEAQETEVLKEHYDYYELEEHEVIE